MMKKVLVTGLALLMMFGIAACGGKSGPASQVKKDLDRIKNEEVDENLDSLFSDDSLKGKYAEQYAKFIKKIQEFDYKIKEEKVDGDSAVVTVEIKTYDFGKAYKDTYDQVLAAAQDGTLTANSDIKSYVYENMFKNLLAVKDKTYTKEINIKCKKKDGKWETEITKNSELQDAVLGGMMTSISTVG